MAITSRFIGAIAEVEKMLGRGFYRWISTLHLNELPLRHLAKMYLGETSGRNSFKSGLGKALKMLKNPKIAAFPAIPNAAFPVLEEGVVASLSQDQKILYR
jgi:hypothetical protein